MDVDVAGLAVILVSDHRHQHGLEVLPNDNGQLFDAVVEGGFVVYS